MKFTTEEVIEIVDGINEMIHGVKSFYVVNPEYDNIGIINYFDKVETFLDNLEEEPSEEQLRILNQYDREVLIIFSWFSVKEDDIEIMINN